ncbi:hypothetical protein AMECASPLE_013082 [Ameca splendens]|uniref:Uncharacterized protein n=1 Tax=Ameca splendens TaxID=208324 RepID=A0ABV0YCP0_9TELE
MSVGLSDAFLSGLRVKNGTADPPLFSLLFPPADTELWEPFKATKSSHQARQPMDRLLRCSFLLQPTEDSRSCRNDPPLRWVCFDRLCCSVTELCASLTH